MSRLTSYKANTVLKVEFNQRRRRMHYRSRNMHNTRFFRNIKQWTEFDCSAEPRPWLSDNATLSHDQSATTNPYYTISRRSLAPQPTPAREPRQDNIHLRKMFRLLSQFAPAKTIECLSKPKINNYTITCLVSGYVILLIRVIITYDFVSMHKCGIFLRAMCATYSPCSTRLKNNINMLKW